MKILCYSTSEDYRPDPFNYDSVEAILEKVLKEIQSQYSKRYKKLEVDFDDINYHADSMKSNVVVYNNDRVIFTNTFEFVPYSDYFDESDYHQHLDTTIEKFVRNLI